MRRNNHGMMNDSLQDLDRELSLLRRKRELIEEQQLLLNRPMGHISPWAEPPQRDYNSHGSQQGYIEPKVSNFYDNNRGFNPRPNSRKRPSEVQEAWEPSPKRFDRPLPAQSRPRGRVDYRPRFNERSAPKPQPRSSFAPRSDSRPYRPKPAPKPAPPRAEPKPSASVPPEPPVIIRADEETPPAVAGRMELALGAVYAEVRAQHKRLPHHFFSSFANGKVMKQAIRSRIKSLWIGRPVGTREEIVAAYWRAFPDARDVVALVPTGRYEPAPGEEAEKIARKQEASIKHLKENTKTLLDCQLDGMFKKLSQLYEGDEATNEVDIIREIIKAESTDSEKIESGAETSITDKTDADTTDAAKSDPDNTDTAKTDANNAVGDAETGEKKKAEEKVEKRVQLIHSLYNKLFTTVFNHRVPGLLPRFRKNIIRIIKSDTSIEEGKAILAAEAKKADNDKKPAEDNQVATAKDDTVRKEIPYFVAVIGHPKLPKRAKLSKFLSQFNPLSIKKHKHVYNILFVGVGTKKDYDNILASNDIPLAGTLITIKPSNRSKNPPNGPMAPKAEESFTEDIVIMEDRIGDTDEADISINSDMEGKIDDLLNSLKNNEATGNEETIDKQQEEELLGENNENEEVKDVANDAEMVNVENGKPVNVGEATGEKISVEETVDSAQADAGTKEMEVDEEKIVNNENGKEENVGEKIAKDAKIGEETAKVEKVGEETRKEETVSNKNREEPKEKEETKLTVEDDEVKVNTPAPVRATRRTSRLANK